MTITIRVGGRREKESKVNKIVNSNGTRGIILMRKWCTGCLMPVWCTYDVWCSSVRGIPACVRHVCVSCMQNAQWSCRMWCVHSGLCINDSHANNVHMLELNFLFGWMKTARRVFFYSCDMHVTPPLSPPPPSSIFAYSFFMLKSFCQFAWFFVVAFLFESFKVWSCFRHFDMHEHEHVLLLYLFGVYRRMSARAYFVCFAFATPDSADAVCAHFFFLLLLPLNNIVLDHFSHAMCQ